MPEKAAQKEPGKKPVPSKKPKPQQEVVVQIPLRCGRMRITETMRIACVLKVYWFLIKAAPMYVNNFFWDFRL